jgi:hypothetical protein
MNIRQVKMFSTKQERRSDSDAKIFEPHHYIFTADRLPPNLTPIYAQVTKYFHQECSNLFYFGVG